MIKIFSNIEELYRFAAEKFVDIAEDSTKKHGRFSVALSGGSTPKAFHQLLTGEMFVNKIDWEKVFFFFGDERNVPPEDQESNFRMANETLFKPLNIKSNHIYRWQTEIKDGEKTAADYEKKLRIFFELKLNELPRFDLVLLGMGDDGHTASLFPFTEALNETVKIAVANPVEKLDTTRLTLTFPVINNARNTIFLVKGADKAEVLREVLEGAKQPEKLPSQSVNLSGGNLFWLVDESAAQFLNRKTI